MPQFLLTFDCLYLYYFFFHKNVRHSSINFKMTIYLKRCLVFFLSLNGHFSLKIFIVKTDRNAKLQCEIT